MEYDTIDQSSTSSVVLFVYLHCLGCVKKVEKIVKSFKGVEDVKMNMEENQVTVTGEVDHEALCLKIQKKTRKKANILYLTPPLQKPHSEQELHSEPESTMDTEGATPQHLHSRVDGLNTVELDANMSCAGCAKHLKKKILKIKGVQRVDTDLSTGKVIVTGTNSMDANELAVIVSRRTKQKTRIVPTPEHYQHDMHEEFDAPEETNDVPEHFQHDMHEEFDAPKETNEDDITMPEEEQDTNTEDVMHEEQQEGYENYGTQRYEDQLQESNGSNSIRSDQEMINKDEMMTKMMRYYPLLSKIEKMAPSQLFRDDKNEPCCIS